VVFLATLTKGLTSHPLHGDGHVAGRQFKVLAHLLPNLVPPVDREYTLTFLFGNKQIANDMEKEWQKLRQILQGFFHPVVQNPIFQARAEQWLAQPERLRWDTSALKILDNLVIALSALSRGEKEAANAQAV
jgi:hypothetical protein